MALPNIIQNHTNDITTLTTEIATKAYDNNVVHLTDKETITGAKTFTSNIYRSSPNVDISDISTIEGVHNTYIVFKDKNNVDISAIQSRVTNEVNQLRFGVRIPGDTTTAMSSTIRFYCEAFPDGTINLIAPTPDKDSNSRAVATTAWVRGKGVLVESSISGTTWYRKYSDGWIEQGGYVSTGATLTFPKAFSNTNYNVVLGSVTTSTYTTQYTQILLSSKTATSVSGTKNSGVGLYVYACGY